jgi:hypothetical protein
VTGEGSGSGLANAMIAKLISENGSSEKHT